MFTQRSSGNRNIDMTYLLTSPANSSDAGDTEKCRRRNYRHSPSQGIGAPVRFVDTDTCKKVDSKPVPDDPPGPSSASPKKKVRL